MTNQEYKPSKPWLRFLKSEKWNQRYTLCIMGILGYANLYTNRICLNQAMETIVTSQHGKPPEFVWNGVEQGWAKAAFYMGYIPTHMPGGLLADRYGGKIVFGLGVLFTAATCLLTPVLTRSFGLAGMITVRVVMGAGEGVTYPAGSNLVSKWTPPEERGRIGGYVMAGNQLGTILGNIGTGFLLENYDWPISFYVWGGVCILYCIIYYFVVFSRPMYHPFISDRERMFLEEKVQAVTEDSKGVPWKFIFTSCPVWLLIVCQAGHDWGYFVMLTDLPKFMRQVMHFSPGERGLMTSIPYVVMWGSSMLFC